MSKRRERTWQDNAREFKELDAGEGWPFARLIACSVEKGNGNGRPPKTPAAAGVSGKVSGEAFARLAGTDGRRVLRYLAAWDKAAEKGWVPASDTLTPGDVVGMADPEHPWDGADGVYSAGRTKVQDIATNPSNTAAALEDPDVMQKVIDRLTPEAVASLATKVVAVSDDAADAAREALFDRPVSPTIHKIVQDSNRKRREDDEADHRSDDYGVYLEAKIHLLVDELVQFNHRAVLLRVQGYVNGQVDAEDADHLTPEMFG